jgi:hypothetical protein
VALGTATRHFPLLPSIRDGCDLLVGPDPIGRALDRLSLIVHAGGEQDFLRPNGSRKTMTLRIRSARCMRTAAWQSSLAAIPWRDATIAHRWPA